MITLLFMMGSGVWVEGINKVILLGLRTHSSDTEIDYLDDLRWATPFRRSTDDSAVEAEYGKPRVCLGPGAGHRQACGDRV